SIPNMDGYLFPATYDIAPNSSAREIIRTMVDRMNTELKKYGVTDANRHKVLTLASVVQREARATADFYKVARVFQNRLDAGMPLQSCATISYFTGGSSFVNTAAERATKNPYNTYLYPGLPIGPIGAPGSLAIDAALHPTPGPWFYFVAVNLKTGETVFSATYAEHLKAVSRWDAWLRQNPEWIGK
ncbi:MAG: endolytic transglycosylase MltG, partial [Rhodoluna sp.]|nr:endolytic transglycosylase MltG [Rhodoluna sp.]